VNYLGIVTIRGIFWRILILPASINVHELVIPGGITVPPRWISHELLDNNTFFVGKEDGSVVLSYRVKDGKLLHGELLVTTKGQTEHLVEPLLK
jgi:hypothetical protein